MENSKPEEQVQENAASQAAQPETVAPAPETPVVEGASSQIQVPPKLIDQVIGQERAVEVIRKAATQRRHVMMIGSPGTGKSMLAKAMAELLPKEDLQDIMVYPNSDDPNNPIIRTVAAGRGKQIVSAHKIEAKKKVQFRNTLLLILLIGIVGYAFITYQWLMGIIAAAFVFMALRYTMPREETMVPKLLVSNDVKSNPPFIDGTGTHAGALLGDVRHDPFQSGGLETPAHDRVEAGAIHRSNGGVLFIDEINTLDPHSQQNLLTALQEGEFPITGQSERSSGAMVRTEPFPAGSLWWLPETLMQSRACTRHYVPVSAATGTKSTWQKTWKTLQRTSRSISGSLRRRSRMMQRSHILTRVPSMRSFARPAGDQTVKVT